MLDSVVPADGPDPFARDAFAASRRVLRELCADGACRLATPNVTRDLRRAVRSLERRPLSGRVVSPSGRRVRVSLDAPALWSVLLAGDLNPALRAELPGALRAMLRGDRTPILRLRRASDGLTGTAEPHGRPRGGLASGDPNDTLFVTTRCEETPFPWTRTAGTTTRLRQAVAAARRIPSAAFAPFGRLASLEAGLFELCAHWPARLGRAEARRPAARRADARAQRRDRPADVDRAGARRRRVDQRRTRRRRRHTPGTRC